MLDLLDYGGYSAILLLCIYCISMREIRVKSYMNMHTDPMAFVKDTSQIILFAVRKHFGNHAVAAFFSGCGL